jgi:HsdM N-terminal domain
VVGEIKECSLSFRFLLKSAHNVSRVFWLVDPYFLSDTFQICHGAPERQLQRGAELSLSGACDLPCPFTKERTIIMAKATKAKNGMAANAGYEAELWRMADALRRSMDAAEYKHVVLGLIFLKYISDAFEAQHEMLEAERIQGADPEDPDEYRALNIFWVPPARLWTKPARPRSTVTPPGAGMPSTRTN